MICAILVANSLPSSLYDPIDNDRHYDMYYYPNLFTDSCTYVTNGSKGLTLLMTRYQSIYTIPGHHKVLNTPHSSATLQTCHVRLKKSKQYYYPPFPINTGSQHQESAQTKFQKILQADWTHRWSTIQNMMKITFNYISTHQ